MLSVFNCVGDVCNTGVAKVCKSSLQQLRFAKIEKSYIWGDKPIISLHPGQLIETALDESSNYGDTVQLLAELSETEHVFDPQVVATNCAFLANHWSDNFFHWMTECLPRVAYLELKGFSGGYLIPNKIRFIVESMVAMGVDQSRLAVYHADTIAKGLVVFDKFPFHGLPDHADVFFYVREKMRQASAGFSGAKRIYSHRAYTRRVINVEDVCAVCAQYDFTFVDFDKLTLFEQIAMVANADILVGPHGAGMIHSWFMPKEATVVEFFSKNYVNYTIYPFIKLLNLNYIPLSEYKNDDECGSNQHNRESCCKADMTVPVEMLDAILHNTIENRADRSDAR